MYTKVTTTFIREMMEMSQEQWLTLVILATEEAEIGKILVQGQPGQNITLNPSQSINQALVAPACHSSHEGRLR
jgi:hypothetical protein